MTSTAPPLRLSSPGQVAAAVPHLVGFVPAESLVVLSLRGKRVGLVMRFDLPREQDEDLLADEVAARVRLDGGTAAALVLLTDGPDRSALVGATCAALEDAGVQVREAVRVRGGLWSSYRCEQDCCPPAGTPVVADGAVQALAAEAALQGRAVLASRDELVDSLAAVGGDAVVRSHERARDAFLAGRARRNPRRVREQALTEWRRAVRRWSRPPAQLAPGEAEALVATLQDKELRDEVTALVLEADDAFVRLLCDLARATPAPVDAPVCTVLAWAAWAEGEGGLAQVALDRALGSDPDYQLAVLAREGLHQQLPPFQVRALLREMRAEVRQRSA